MTKVHEYKVGELNSKIIIDMELRVLECCQYSLSLNSGLLSSREFFLRYFEIVEAYVEDQMKFPQSQVNYFDDGGLFDEGFELVVPLSACKNFGLFLLTIAEMYPTSLYKYGPN